MGKIRCVRWCRRSHSPALCCWQGAAAEAACVRKGGKGTGGSRDSAMFQAWEAVLQATDLGLVGAAS